MRTPPPPRGGGAATPGPPGPRPHGPRRRRRRGRGDREPARPPAPAVVPETSHLTARAAAEAPLTPAEVTEMKEHLAFLRRYREVLRLKLNAAEDLLVNQQREPSERGVCRHLLGKVDRAVIERAIEREPLHGDAAARARMLAGAVRLTADVGVLLAYLQAPAHVRAGMLELAIGPGVSPAVADRAVGVLLPSLQRDGRSYARFAIRRAGQLLARHVDDKARAVLQELRRAQPGARTAERWLTALDARRFGRIALAGEPPAHGRLIAAFWLDAQRPVWLRTASAGAGERVAAEASLQAELALPGVAAVVEHGVALGLPYVAVLGPGRPLAREQSVDAPTGLAILAAATRVLHAVALAGVALPDANVERFLCTAPPAVALTLADLDGARRATPAVAGDEHAALVARLAGAVAPGAGERFVREVGEQAAKEPSLPALIALIERVALRAGPD